MPYKNREKRLQYMKEWAKEHKEQRRKASKKYRESHQQECSKRSMEWQKKHPEAKRKAYNKWLNKRGNREKINLQVRLRRIKRKIKVVDLKGGKCSLCGYSRNLAVLELHHPNGSKDANWGSLLTWRWQKILEAIKDTVLLCSNCHREKHFPKLMLESLEELK